AIVDFEPTLGERQIGCKRLATSHAFHSAMLDPILAEFTAAVSQVERRPPTLPFISCVTGTWVTSEQATSADYWALQLRHTVRCADGLDALKRDGYLGWEVGPGRTLTNLARAAGLEAIPTLPGG